MNNHIVCGLLFFYCIPTSCFNRQRIMFINNAPEIVYVAIHLEPSEPLEREAAPYLSRTFFFPELISEDNFYYITIKSASHEIRYTLHLFGNLAISNAHSCRAYGELQLMRDDLVVQTLSASSIAQGLVLTYSADYQLTIGLSYVAARPHEPACRKRVHRTCCCTCKRVIS